MKLSYMLAFGLGYALGHPTGRERARQVPGQLRELAARPQVQELKEKGTAMAGQATEAAKQRLGRSSDGSDSGTAAGTTDTDRPRRRLMVRPRRRPGGVEATTTGPVTSGDPVTDVRSAELTEPALAAETEAAALGTLPPATPSPGRSVR